MPRTPERLAARRQILEVANNVREAPGKFTMRQLHEALHIVRKSGLVPLSVIVAAGFREKP